MTLYCNNVVLGFYTGISYMTVLLQYRLFLHTSMTGNRNWKKVKDLYVHVHHALHH